MTEHTDILVIGAGVSGLTAAWRLHQAGREVRVLESGDSVGGCTQSEHRDGCILEKGPFNVIVRDPAFEALLEEFADDLPVVAASLEAGKRRFVLRGDRLVEVPSGPVKLLTSPLLSIPARLRLFRGLFLSRRGAETDSIDDAAARRLGPEFAEVLVSAMVSGIVAGDSRRLHLRSAFPTLSKIDRVAISPIGHMVRRAFTGGPRHRRKWRGLISFRRGLGSLPDAIARRLGQRVETGAVVTSIQPTESGYEVRYVRNGYERTVTCRRVILATPLLPAANLIEPMSAEAATMMRSVHSTSLIVLNLGLDESTVEHPLRGYGFLVPRTETEFPLLGVLFADSVFPHHAPGKRRMMRVFMGGARDPGAADRSDSELLALAQPQLERILGLKGDPELIDICRYRDAIPQYELDHDELISLLRTHIARLPGLHLAGNYLTGVSINDCIGGASRLADEILTHTNPRDRAIAATRETASLQAVT